MSNDLIRIPPRLMRGSTVAICSASESIGLEAFGDIARARSHLRKIGLNVEIPWDGVIPDEFSSSDCALRADQIRDAIHRDDVSAIIIGKGGFNAIDVLDCLDIPELANAGPKIVCGMSDSSIFTTALLAQNRWQTYYGPNFATFGQGPEAEHTLEHFKAVMMRPPTDKISVTAAPTYGEVKGDRKSDTNYILDDEGPRTVYPGVADGMIFGGNLGTLFLLQGTEYWPDNRDDTILFVEDDDLAGAHTLVEALRRLRSLLMQPNLKGQVAGLVVGRFQKDADAPLDLVEQGLRAIPALREIPVVINAPFGHTNPMATIPIGGWAWIEASPEAVDIAVACSRG